MQNTQGYRDFQDTLHQSDRIDQEHYDDFFDERHVTKTHNRFRSRTRDQYGASLAWSLPMLGSVNITTKHTNRFDSQSAQTLSASWSKMIDKASVSMNVQKSTGYGGYGADQGLATFLTVSMPLRGQARTFVNIDKQRTRSGASYSD